MLTKQAIINAAHRMGFIDIGFTSAAPFETHKEYLLAHQEEYAWTEARGLDLLAGTDPKTLFPQAQAIIVLFENYYQEAFPIPLEQHFGRCYLDDDRVTKDGLALRIKEFRRFLQADGIDSRVPFNLPHRLAAARAGLGTFGQNCLFYAGRAARGSSWVLPMTIVIDREYPSDEPTIGMGCPEWCRKACVAAKAQDLDLVRLLHMDESYFEAHIWPHMFYMNTGDLWRWKMNVARAMGNSLDRCYVPELVRALSENADERVREMTTWALGRLGGSPQGVPPHSGQA